AAAGAFLTTLAWTFCSAVHDHARIRAFTNSEGALASYRWALGFVLHGGRRAFRVALTLLAIGLILSAFYQAIASFIQADWMTGVVLSILWGQAMLLSRALVRVWTMSAEAHLQGE